MKTLTYLAMLTAGLAVLLACSAAAAAATSVVHDGELELKSTQDVAFFISGILDILLRPLKQLLLTQINSIINSIKDQGGLIIGNAKKLVDSLLEVIRPFIIRILDQLNNIIGAGVSLKERLTMAVQELFRYLGVINNANKEILKTLIMYIVEKLLPTSAAVLDAFRVVADSPYLLDKIKEHLIKPILEFARTQVQSIIRSIIDQTGLIGAELLKHADVIAELIRPHVIRILDITGNLHGEAIHLRKAVQQAVASIIGSIGAIGSESVQMVALLIEKVTDILVSKISPNAFLIATNPESEAFLIVDRIISWIVQPILNKINGILDQVRRLIEDKTDEAKAKLLRLYDELTLLLKDPVIKIIGVLGDIGIEIKDVATAIKKALEMLIDSVSGIHEANKAMFKSILTHIISGLLKLIDNKKAVSVSFDFSILSVLINRILGPVIDSINKTLSTLRENIGKHIGNGDNLIREAVENLAQSMAPYIVRIVEVFVQIGIGSSDLVENVRIIMQLILRNLSSIAEPNKQLFNQIMGNLIGRIVEIIRANNEIRPEPTD